MNNSMIRAIQKIRLCRAVRKNDLEQVKRLVESGADLNITDQEGCSLLAIAYHYNSSNLIDYLRDKGIREEINRLYNYARRCLKEGNPLEAKKRFEELLKFFPDDSAIFYYLGATNIKLSKSEEPENDSFTNLMDDAYKNLSKALELNEEDYRLDDLKIADTNYMLGLCFHHQDKPDMAVAYAQKALENVEEHEGAAELLKKLDSVNA